MRAFRLNGECVVSTRSVQGVLLVTLFAANLGPVSGQPNPGEQPEHHHKHLDLDHLEQDDINEDFFDTIADDREHLMEHMEDFTYSMKSGMTTEEEKFHFFRVHDTDDSGGLDGQELLKTLLHVNPLQVLPDVPDHAPAARHQLKLKSEERNQRIINAVAKVVDTTLSKHDWNLDGYIDYQEFIQGAVNMFHPSTSHVSA